MSFPAFRFLVCFGLFFHATDATLPFLSGRAGSRLSPRVCWPARLPEGLIGIVPDLWLIQSWESHSPCAGLPHGRLQCKGPARLALGLLLFAITSASGTVCHFHSLILLIDKNRTHLGHRSHMQQHYKINLLDFLIKFCHLWVMTVWFFPPQILPHFIIFTSFWLTLLASSFACRDQQTSF